MLHRRQQLEGPDSAAKVALNRELARLVQIEAVFIRPKKLHGADQHISAVVLYNLEV